MDLDVQTRLGVNTCVVVHCNLLRVRFEGLEGKVGHSSCKFFNAPQEYGLIFCFNLTRINIVIK